jgi:hypothetical protein
MSTLIHLCQKRFSTRKRKTMSHLKGWQQNSKGQKWTETNRNRTLSLIHLCQKSAVSVGLGPFLPLRILLPSFQMAHRFPGISSNANIRRRIYFSWDSLRNHMSVQHKETKNDECLRLYICVKRVRFLLVSVHFCPLEFCCHPFRWLIH